MSSSKEQERDPEYRLSSTQVNDLHKRDPEDRRSLSIITLEKYAQFQDHRVFHLTNQGEFVKRLQIKPPEAIVDMLEYCISLRKKLNHHFENLAEDKIHPSIMLEEHRVANTKHKFLIIILEELLSMLVPQPNNNPVDPDQVLRQEIVGRMCNVLKAMYKMTEGVMNAWERYCSNQLSLFQATLVTHAAVERSQVLEKNFRDGQNHKEQQFVQQHFADYDPKRLMDTKANPWLDLDWDVRVLNYPGELSKTEIATREKNMKLKSQYRDQIKIIWKFLHEILFIHKHQLGGDQQATVFGTLQGLPGEAEDNKIFLPADIFSKALSDVIKKPGEISMSTSYAIQLLAKICLRFQALSESSADPKSFSFRQDTTNKAPTAYLHVTDSDGGLISKHFLPIRANVPRIHEVDGLFLDTDKCDVTWHAKTTEFYFNTQPLYAGTLELARTLAEYRADLAYANDTLSIFALGHLKLAPGASQMIENFSLSPKVNAATSQQQDWIPDSFKATSVEDVLNMIKDKTQKYWGVLPWDDTDDNFLLAATQCNASLATLGNLEGPQKYKDESQQSFNLRGLHTFLWLWKVIEKENEKRGEPFDKEDEDKIKDNMADQYKDAKRRQQGSGKRKSGGSSRQHLARSDKKEKILDESAACVFIMESRPSCRRRSDVVDDLGLSFKR
ncbi:hypothetical protein BKA80DRAFT_252501 [Phyllosticta citrichinensis]